MILHQLILLLALTEFSELQRSISWIERYDQVDSSCTSASVLEGDNIIMYSRISIGGQNDLMDRAQYEIKKRGLTYETLCYVDLTKCKGYTLSNCYCNTMSEKYVIDVTINVTALTSISEAAIKGTVYNYNNQIYTEEIKLPVVYESSKVDMEIYINGKLMNNDQCEETINGRNAAILFKTSQNIPVALTAMNNYTGQLLKNESDILKFITDVKNQNSIKLTYEISEVPKSRHSTVCKIKADDKCIDVQKRLYVFICLFISVLLLVIVTVLIIVCVKAKYVLVFGKLKNSEENMDENVYVHDERTSALEVDITVDDKKRSVNSKFVGQDTNGQLLPTDVVGLIIKEVKSSLENIITNPTSSMDQFPDKYRQVIQFQLNNMVKIKINKTSNRRPKHWPGETIPYPYYSSGGCDTERLGVGRIVDVKLINKDNRETSLVRKSQYPKFDKTEWIEVTVYTSRHVVFDDIEAKHTTCSLLLNDFGSDDTSPNLSTSSLTNYTRNSSITFKGVLVNMANIDENWILFTCTSDDLFCINDLKHNLSDFNRKWRKIMFNSWLYEDVQNKGILVEINNKERKQMKDISKKTNNVLKQRNDYLEQTKEYLERTNEYFKKINNHLKQTEDHLVQKKDYLEQRNDYLEQRNDYLEQRKDYLEQGNDYLKLTKNQLKPTEDHLEQTKKYFKQTKNQLKETEDHLIYANDYLKQTKEYLKQYKDYLKRMENHLKKMEKEKTRDFLKQTKDFSKRTYNFLELTKIYLEHTKNFLERIRNYLKHTTYSAKLAEFSELLNVYFQPTRLKQLSYTLNTYFPKQNLVIYFEINNDYNRRHYQKEIQQQEYFKQKRFYFTSFPVVLKFSEEFIV